MRKVLSMIQRNDLSAMSIVRTTVFALQLILTGCAIGGSDSSSSSAGRAPASAKGDYDSNSRAHPAAYLVDRFPVNRPMPQREKSNVEFYFKRCTMTGDDWPRSNTRYDCDYP